MLIYEAEGADAAQYKGSGSQHCLVSPGLWHEEHPTIFCIPLSCPHFDSVSDFLSQEKDRPVNGMCTAEEVGFVALANFRLFRGLQAS